MLEKFHEIPVWFTEDLEKLEQWFGSGVSTATIAAKLGKSTRAVNQKIEQLGLRAPSSGSTAFYGDQLFSLNFKLKAA